MNEEVNAECLTDHDLRGVARRMRDRDINALPTKDELLERLSEDGYSDVELTGIRDDLMKTLGFDPVWRYPFCHDAGLGAVLVPVREGFLWLPYDVIDYEAREIYEPERATLLTAKGCSHLIREMLAYTDALTAVMRYVADELAASERTEISKD